jgi:hypothetical protein
MLFSKNNSMNSYLTFDKFIAISVVNSFHPSATQRKVDYLNVELDVEKNLQAAVAKDRIRIKEFF